MVGDSVEDVSHLALAFLGGDLVQCHLQRGPGQIFDNRPDQMKTSAKFVVFFFLLRDQGGFAGLGAG